MNDKIWLSSPHMGDNELNYVQDAFATNWIAPLGPHVNGFEEDLAQYNNIGHVAALSSGTAAIHLALVLLGVKANDLVICQSFTFCGSANPIKYLGAEPVFIDSEVDTWNMDPLALEEALEVLQAKGKMNKVKAIIPVHLYGMPAKMREIKAVAEKYNIPIIEDAAEALGSHIDQKMCGTFGDLGVFSFNGNKIITTSGGGALASNNKEWIDQSRFLATQARDNAPHYEHSQIGYNYRMSNVLAGIGRGQMEVLNDRIAARRANFEFYKDLFASVEGISMIDEPNGFYSNRWLSAILVNPDLTGGITREDIRLHLEKDNIESRPLWKPMHMQPVFKNCQYYGNQVAENLFKNGLCLPSGSNLTEADRERIAQQLKAILSI